MVEDNQKQKQSCGFVCFATIITMAILIVVLSILIMPFLTPVSMSTYYSDYQKYVDANNLHDVDLRCEQCFEEIGIKDNTSLFMYRWLTINTFDDPNIIVVKYEVISTCRMYCEV